MFVPAFRTTHPDRLERSFKAILLSDDAAKEQGRLFFLLSSLLVHYFFCMPFERHVRDMSEQSFCLSCKAILQSDVAAKKEARRFSKYMADVGR
jgi:hypothetical protein